MDLPLVDSTSDIVGRECCPGDGFELTHDVAADGPGRDEVDREKVMQQLRQFGQSHAVLTIDNLPRWCGLGDPFCALGCVRRYVVTMARSGGDTETLLEGEFSNPENPDWTNRTTQISSFPATEGEEVEVCLTLYTQDGAQYAYGCQHNSLLTGRSGQVIWKLVDGGFLKGTSCPDPTTVDTQSDLPECKLVFGFLVTLGYTQHFPPSEKTLYVTFYPSVPCSEAQEWLFSRYALAMDKVEVSCLQPLAEMVDPTSLQVTLPDPYTALGLFVGLLETAGVVPAIEVYNLSLVDIPAQQPMVGVSWGQAGLAQAQWECEYLGTY